LSTGWTDTPSVHSVGALVSEKSCAVEVTASSTG
jgi:hypothetical protein